MPKSITYDPHKIKKLFELFGCSFGNTDSKEASAEACPFCGGTKFSLNVETTQWQCFHGSCQQKGNVYTFINAMYETCLTTTEDRRYHYLMRKRGLSMQTLKRHGLALHDSCWLVPFKSKEGKVLNMVRYFPNNPPEKKNKFNLPGLPLKLYGLDKLGSDPEKLLFVCEGPFDAIALDQQLTRLKSRKRYDIIAVPAAGIFSDAWLPLLKEREVRLVFDNDKAGRDGQQRIVKLCGERKVDCKISYLNWPAHFSAGYDVDRLVQREIPVVDFTRKHCTDFAGKGNSSLCEATRSNLKRKRGWTTGGYPSGNSSAYRGRKGVTRATSRATMQRGRRPACRCPAAVPNTRHSTSCTLPPRTPRPL